MQLFLATETYSQCVSLRNSRVEHTLDAGAAPSWIRVCLIMLVSLLLSLAEFSAVVLLPPL